MNPKQMSGLVFLSIGVVLMIFSLHSMGLIEKKQRVEALTNSPLSPTERLPDGSVARAQSADGLLVLLGGVVLVMIGGGIAFYCRK